MDSEIVEFRKITTLALLSAVLLCGAYTGNVNYWIITIICPTAIA